MKTGNVYVCYIHRHLKELKLVVGKICDEYKYKIKLYRKPFVGLLLLFVKLLNCCLQENEGDEDCGKRL